MPSDRKRTRDENRHVTGMVESLETMEIEMKLIGRMRDIVPEGWSGLDREAPCRAPKKKMTIRLDADVLEWYRGLGLGYQNRINKVLRCYMHAILSKYIEGQGDRDWMDRPV